MLPLQGTWVRSLVRERRSRMPHGSQKTKTNNIFIDFLLCSQCKFSSLSAHRLKYFLKTLFHQFFLFSFFFFFLAALGRHVRSSLKHAGSFIAACRLLSSCGAQAPGRVGSVVVVCGLCGLRHMGSS